jgi:hypothetical protein
VGRIDGYQQKITSIVQSLSSKLAEKLVLFEERIAKLQKEGCQKDLEPWQRARDAIIQTQRFLSNPECIESPGITFAFFLENLGLEETVEIGTKLLDESLLLESLSTEKECLLISQSNFHNLEEDLLKQHGNPKDLEALLPVESECDRAIVETFNKAREESLPKEEDLSVQYFLAKLESDAKSKIEKFSQIAARVVPL